MSDATGNTVTLYTRYTGTSAVYSHVVHLRWSAIITNVLCVFYELRRKSIIDCERSCGRQRRCLVYCVRYIINNKYTRSPETIPSNDTGRGRPCAVELLLLCIKIWMCVTNSLGVWNIVYSINITHYTSYFVVRFSI